MLFNDLSVLIYFLINLIKLSKFVFGRADSQSELLLVCIPGYQDVLVVLEVLDGQRGPPHVPGAVELQPARNHSRHLYNSSRFNIFSIVLKNVESDVLHHV